MLSVFLLCGPLIPRAENEKADAHDGHQRRSETQLRILQTRVDAKANHERAAKKATVGTRSCHLRALAENGVDGSVCLGECLCAAL